MDGEITLEELHPDLKKQVEYATTHLAENNAHGIGDKATLKTIDKTSIVAAINEVFTNGNNVKKDVVDALLSIDGALPISQSNTWQQLIDFLEAAESVGGLKYAAGSTTLVNQGNLIVSGLTFKADVVLARSNSLSRTAVGVSNDFTGGSTPLALFAINTTAGGNSSFDTYDTSFNFNVNTSAVSGTFDWVAIKLGGVI